MISALCNSYFHLTQVLHFFFVNIPSFLMIFTKSSLNSFAISISSSIILLFSTNFIAALALTLFQKIHRIYIKIWKIFFFLAFFKSFMQKFRCFLYFFWDISVLSRKKLLDILSLELYVSQLPYVNLLS